MERNHHPKAARMARELLALMQVTRAIARSHLELERRGAAGGKSGWHVG